MPDNVDLIQQMLREVLTKIDTLTSQISTTQIDHANLRGELTTRILEQGTTFDAKLMAAERRLEEKASTRAEKVDSWFDKVDDQFNAYKLETEKKITTVSVKVGIIFSIATAIIIALITVVSRLVFHQ